MRWAGRNKLAKMVGVSGPYSDHVLSGKKPMREELAEKQLNSVVTDV
jgi:hypothetical protein